MNERSSSLPTIGFSAGADYDTLFSLVSGWTVEVVFDDGSYIQGVIVWDDSSLSHYVYDEDEDVNLLTLTDVVLLKVRQVIVF